MLLDVVIPAVILHQLISGSCDDFGHGQIECGNSESIAALVLSKIDYYQITYNALCPAVCIQKLAVLRHIIVDIAYKKITESEIV